MISFNRLFYACFGICAFVVFVSACSSDNVWDIERDVFAEKLRRGDYAFFEDIDFGEADPEEIHELGPGSATAAALIFMRSGWNDAAETMLAAEWSAGAEGWKRDAGFALARVYLEREDYGSCLSLSEELYREYGGYGPYRMMLESLYWLRHDAETVRMIAEAGELFPGETARDTELVLFEAASSSRLGVPEWRGLFRKLFLSVPAGELHVRALEYLRGTGMISEGFTPADLAVFDLKYSLAGGEYLNGAEQAEQLFRAAASGDTAGDAAGAGYVNEILLEDTALIFLLADRPFEGHELLEPFTDDSRFAPVRGKLLEVLGRLLRKAGLYEQAVLRFEQASASRPGSERQRDRLLWFRADCMGKISPLRLVRFLPDLVELWSSPSYFSDILDDLATSLTASGRWELIDTSWEVLRGNADPAVSARFGYILYRAVKAGLYRSPRITGDSVPDELLGNALDPGAGHYYNMIASVRTGKKPWMLSGEAADVPETAAPGENNPGADYRSRRVRKFIDFGLLREAFGEARTAGGDVPGPLLLELSEKLEGEGLYREAVLAAAEASRKLFPEPGRALPPEFLKRIYPRYYSGFAASAAEEYSVPENLLYSLVREESYFDARIVSRAGAVGLTQLMPPTAAEMSRRLKTGEFDILDPETNLRFGGYYFSTLLDRFMTATHAVSAYNAGPTRVRRWERRLDFLPADLFLEAIPFDETRYHCMKVLVSAVFYGYLYSGLEPGAVINEFFPGFAEETNTQQ